MRIIALSCVIIHVYVCGDDQITTGCCCRGEGQKFKNFKVSEDGRTVYFTMSQNNPQQSISVSVSEAELEVILSTVRVRAVVVMV